jgi:hypothetical protein
VATDMALSSLEAEDIEGPPSVSKALNRCLGDHPNSDSRRERGVLLDERET